MIFLKALRHLLTLVVVLLCLAVGFAAWSVRIQPVEAGQLVLGWFAFPYLWLALLVVIIVTFAFRSWFAWGVSLIVAICTWPTAREVVDVPIGRAELPEGSKAIKLVTYNIHGFGYSSEMSLEHVRDSLGNFLLNSDADIICLQEAPPMIMMVDKEPGRSLLKAYPYYTAWKMHFGGQTILSRHPICCILEPHDEASALDKEGTSKVADIYIGTDTIRLINVHLASLRLSTGEIEAVGGTQSMTDERLATVNSAFDKLASAFKERQGEVEKVVKMVEASPHPTILCGDFNDTPVSNTYYSLTHTKKNLNDSRRPRRLGLARTYRGNLPPLRIDYVLTSDEIATADYAEHDMPISDHKAVSVSFALR